MLRISSSELVINCLLQDVTGSKDKETWMIYSVADPSLVPRSSVAEMEMRVAHPKHS